LDEATLDRTAALERPRLLGLAYRMTGSRSDAEDIVQEAMLRAHRAAPADVESPAAYLTTITTRLAIDHLRSARVRRESYVGPWLPEPIAADPAPDAASRAELVDTISMAFLVVLETLSPDERAVLILHDVFAYPHAEIAGVLDRTDASCRQLLRRARQRVQDARPRLDVDPARRDELVNRFVAACAGGDMHSFLDLLSDDAVLVVDGGPNVKTAARHPLRGAERIARFLSHVTGRLGSNRRITPTTLNAGPAVLLHAHSGELVGAVFIDTHDGHRGDVIRWVRNPDKLTGLT
jgi:RNA polymerase sigma-70 factor (ECF subfamily)